ncbi:MAG: hypothetical protein LBF97_02780 [Elusimicrobiota bacterium]|jgi:hypothetical protein|nr:hypothetical protein [Elusimicrobiota bacterium]
MNIRELAEKDLKKTLEDIDTGFGRIIKLTNNAGETQIVIGQYHRINADIDPETGMKIKSERSSITIRNSSVIGKIEKKWKVEVKDVNGEIVRGIVKDFMRDDALGITSLFIGVI